MYLYIDIILHIYMYIYINIFIYIYICKTIQNTYIYIFCIYLFLHLYIYIYTHTSIQNKLWRPEQKEYLKNVDILFLLVVVLLTDCGTNILNSQLNPTKPFTTFDDLYEARHDVFKPTP